MKREIGFRGVCLRSADDGDGRTLEGVAVPYGQIIDTWDGAETFDPDCRFDDIESAKLCYQHGELIGRITAAESREDGLHITARVNTARGVACRAVAETLPPYVRPAEPTLEDAYLYLISGEGEA